MKKLIINCLLVLVFVLLVLAVISSISKLRIVDTTDQQVDALMQNTDTAIAEQKATEEQKEVTVTIQQEKAETNDEDVNEFLNDLE